MTDREYTLREIDEQRTVAREADRVALALYAEMKGAAEAFLAAEAASNRAVSAAFAEQRKLSEMVRTTHGEKWDESVARARDAMSRMAEDARRKAERERMEREER